MGHPIFKHMSSGQRYDNKQAYNKDLSDSARLHYLENEEHDKSVSRKASPVNNFKGPYHKVQHAKGEAHKENGVSRESSKSQIAKPSAVYMNTDEGMSRNSSPARVEKNVINNPENSTSNSSYIGEPGGGTNFYIPGEGQGIGGGSITGGMSQEPVVITAKGSGNNISSGKTRVEHRADKTRMKIDATDDTVIKARRVARAERLDKRAAKKEIRQGKRYARKKDKGQRIDNKFGVEGQGGKDYNV